MHTLVVTKEVRLHIELTQVALNDLIIASVCNRIGIRQTSFCRRIHIASRQIRWSHTHRRITT